jgi:transposase-like protein
MAATSYSPEHKARAVQAFLARGTRSVRQVSRELGISHSTLFEWVAASSFDTDSEALASTLESWQAAAINTLKSDH